MRHPAGLGQLALLICQPQQPVRTSTQLPLQQSTDDVVREAHDAQTERDAAGRWGSSLCRHFAITRALRRDIGDILCDPWGLNEKEKAGCRDLRGSLQYPASSLAPKTTAGLQLALHVWLYLAGSACFGIWRYQTETQHSDSGCCIGCYAPSSCYFQRPITSPQQVLL
ncbi:hypothetical protein BGZ61DRAFT_451498, partial [Ilyonectria robusta]|uniref:uncharacterized protein n=1 Tax=Ilyonectria robusta TaxID=1079257 RepID=UPI001E8DF9F7